MRIRLIGVFINAETPETQTRGQKPQKKEKMGGGGGESV